MAYDLEEQEKFDAFKAWWSKYGTLVVGIAVVLLLAWGGWSGYKAYQNHKANQAMGYFEALQDAARLGGADSASRIKAASDTLRKEFADNAYTGRAALMAADALLKQNDPEGARTQLEWLVSRPAHSALQPLARLRLAGVLLDQKKYDEALAQLNSPPEAFAGLYADRRGDIFIEQKKPEQAREAGEDAVKRLGPADPLGQVVRLKLESLSGV